MRNMYSEYTFYLQKYIANLKVGMKNAHKNSEVKLISYIKGEVLWKGLN